MNSKRTPHHQVGAALLLAMLVLTLVSTVAAGMVWHQHRAIEVEAAERARVQAAWLLEGGFDWARLGILARPGIGKGPFPLVFEDGDVGKLIAADRDNTSDSELTIFVSGSIDDAQGRYNLRNLMTPDFKPSGQDIEIFRLLCESIGLGGDLSARISDGLLASWVEPPRPDATLPIHQVRDLSRLGIGAATIALLERFVIIIPSPVPRPGPTPVNAATAPREVLVAVIGASAERIVRQRPQTPDALKLLLPDTEIDPNRITVGTNFFEIRGQLRYEQRASRERMLVERRGNQPIVLQRERENVILPSVR